MQLELPFAISTYVEKPGGRTVSPIRREVARGEQLVLPGCGAKQFDRLFFGIRPTAVDRIHNLAQTFAGEHGLYGRLRGKPLYHITLHELGTVPRDYVTPALEAVQSVNMSPFDVHFDRIMSFANADKNPLVLLGGGNLSGLRELHALIGDALAKSGFKRIRKSFTPHITLLYDSRLIAETPVPPVSWTVHDFVLIRSLRHQSFHRVLQHWTLRG